MYLIIKVKEIVWILHLLQQGRGLNLFRFLTVWLIICLVVVTQCFVFNFQVTILLQNFTDAESSENSEDKEEIIHQINHYNRRFSGEPRPVSTNWTKCLAVKFLKVVFTFYLNCNCSLLFLLIYLLVWWKSESFWFIRFLKSSFLDWLLI